MEVSHTSEDLPNIPHCIDKLLIAFAMASSSSTPLPMSYSPHSTSKSKRSKPSNAKLVNGGIHSQSSPPFEFPSKEQFIQLMGVLAVAVFVGTSASYIVNWSNRYFRPFCDTDADLELSSDSCIPCPEHGRCSGGKLECVPGFKKYHGLCKENRELEKKAQKLAEWIEGFACGLHAQSLCNGAGILWFPSNDLRREVHQLLLKMQPSLNTDEEVAFVEEKAMEIIRNSFEMRTTFDGLEEFKCPDWLAERYKPFECRTQEWISQHYLFLFVVSPVVFTFTKFLWGVYRGKRMIARAEQLYQQVCEALEEKAIMEKSKGKEGEPWVVASRLRDHLLLPRERKNAILWSQVEEFIQEDSRIDRYPKLVKGESRVVLEWQVEGALHSRAQCGDLHQRVFSSQESSNVLDENLPLSHAPVAGLNN